MQIILIAAAIAALVSGLGTWKVTTTFYEAEKAAALREQIAAKEAAEKRAEEISTRFEEKLAKIRVVNRTINNEVTREVLKPDYDCAVPSAGERLLNRARGVETVDTAKPDAALPATGIRIRQESARAITGSGVDGNRLP